MALRSSLVVFVVLGSVAGSAAWASGCSGNPLKQNSLPAERFPAAYAQALCGSLAHCCSENMVSYNYDACTAGWQAAVAAIVGSPDAGANYDPQLAAQCVQQVSAAAEQSCQPVPGSLSAARATCQGIFAGEVPLGGACTASSQCAPIDGGTVVCAVVPLDASVAQLPLAAFDAATGAGGLDVPVCVAVMSVDAGGMPCTPLGTDGGPKKDVCLDYNLFCDPTSMTCLPFNQMGGACDFTTLASCAPGSFCAADGGVCAPAQPPGSPCIDSIECDYTSQCDPGSHTCVLRLLPGTACETDNQCSVSVCDPTTKQCLTNAIATTAACNGVTGTM
jgi:hypothetical protein